MPSLRTEALVTGYGKATILQDVSVEVKEDELVAVIGRNGAGKSTLMLALAGALGAWQGRVLWDGADVTRWPSHRRAAAGLVLVPEGRKVFPQCSVAENLALGAYPRRARADESARLADVLELFPRLKDRRSQLAGTLSGGEQQMLAIGRGLMGQPRLLILDEPSLGLAPGLVLDVLDRVALIRREWKLPILLVEERARRALELADRYYAMRNGQVVGSGRAADLLGDDELESTYLGL